MAWPKARSLAQTLGDASRPAPCWCVNIRASGTPSRWSLTGSSGRGPLMEASRPSHAPSPAPPGEGRGSSACAAPTASKGIRSQTSQPPSRSRLAALAHLVGVDGEFLITLRLASGTDRGNSGEQPLRTGVLGECDGPPAARGAAANIPVIAAED